MTRNWSQS